MSRRLSFALAVLLAFPGIAHAAPPEGCDPQIQAAQQAKAQALVVNSKAMDDEIFVQDDSVLALTCFNQSAAISAQSSGDVFSGDFRPFLAPVVDDALTSMYSNFAHSAGASAGAVGYTQTDAKMPTASGSAPQYDCKQIQKLWNAVNNQGVKSGTPYPTQSELLSGTPAPGSGAAYQQGIQNPNSQAIIGNASQQVAATPVPQSNTALATMPTSTTGCQATIGVNAAAVGTACPPP
jgi:hypothetical protein